MDDAVQTTVENGEAKAQKKHPPYQEMISIAIKALKDRGGSSRVAIDRYIATHFDVQNPKAHIRSSLAKGIEKGHFKLTKGTTYRGYYKLGEVEKKVKKKMEKKPSSAQKATPKKAGVRKSVSAEVKKKKKPTGKATTKTVKGSKSPKKAASKASLKASTPKRPSKPKPKTTPKRPKTTKPKPATKKPAKTDKS